MQDNGNALNLLKNGLIKLKERNQISQDKLNQIDQTTMEMDGNTSTKEEDELVVALKDEMPDFRENVETNFDQITSINQMIKQCEKSEDPKLMKDI